MEVAEMVETSRLRRRLPRPEICRVWREGAQLTQEELAAVVGVTGATLCRWESGTHRPRGAVLARYLLALDALREAGP